MEHLVRESFRGTLKAYLDIVSPTGREYEDDNVHVFTNYDVNDGEPPETHGFRKGDDEHMAVFDEYTGWFAHGPKHALVLDWLLPEGVKVK